MCIKVDTCHGSSALNKVAYGLLTISTITLLVVGVLAFHNIIPNVPPAGSIAMMSISSTILAGLLLTALQNCCEAFDTCSKSTISTN